MARKWRTLMYSEYAAGLTVLPPAGTLSQRLTFVPHAALRVAVKDKIECLDIKSVQEETSELAHVGLGLIGSQHCLRQ
jgi:hypothetical protein